MEPALFGSSALVLVAHGSSVNAQSSLPVRQHGDALRQRGIFGEVVVCFWKEPPPIAGVLDSIQARTVYVVPFFLSQGYFTEQVVPRELGLRQPEDEDFLRVQNRSGRTVHYCEPVGTHTRITSIIRARIEESLSASPPEGFALDQVSLFVAAHGTSRDARSRGAAERQARILRNSNRFASVHAVFLEEDPGVPDCYALARSPDVVVVPFFLSEGMHTAEDLPELLGESRQTIEERLRSGEPIWGNPTERRGKRVWLTPAVGTAPGMVEVILDRVRQMASGSASGPARDDQG